MHPDGPDIVGHVDALVEFAGPALGALLVSMMA